MPPSDEAPHRLSTYPLSIRTYLGSNTLCPFPKKKAADEERYTRRYSGTCEHGDSAGNQAEQVAATCC